MRATHPARSHFYTMKHRLPVLTLAIAALAILAQLSPAVTAALEFSRAAIAQGEWWRFVTTHLTHFDANHLGWDAAVFLLLGAVCERESRQRFIAGLALASVGISAAVWFWQPHFELYRGLSGLDCALFGLFAGSLLRKSERAAKLLGALGLAGVVAKCGAELAIGATLFATGSGYAPVPLAHVVGAIAGVWVAVGPTLVAEPPPTSLRQKSCSPDPRPCR